MQYMTQQHLNWKSTIIGPYEFEWFRSIGGESWTFENLQKVRMFYRHHKFKYFLKRVFWYLWIQYNVSLYLVSFGKQNGFVESIGISGLIVYMRKNLKDIHYNFRNLL